MTLPSAQIPSPADVLGPGVDALLEARPTAAPYVDTGRWGDVIVGHRGQFGLARKRLAAEASAARLPFATGEALSDLARSEYDTPRSSGPVEAVGEVVLTRTVVHYVADEESLAAVTTGATDATDEATMVARGNAAAQLLLYHGTRIWSSAAGTGSHSASPPGLPSSPGFVLLGSMTVNCDVANIMKQEINDHFASLVFHPEADTVSPVDVDDAVPSDGAAVYGFNTVSAQNSLLAVVNACYEALTAHMALEATAGTIRAGTTWAVLASPTAVPPVSGAQYAVTQDTPCGTGSQTVTVPVVATRPGAYGNIPAWVIGGPTLRYTTPTLFDTAATLKFSTTVIRAAGGSEGQTDPELRRAAGAAALGSAGPTTTALIAGALRTVGASRTVVRDDYSTGAAVVYPVDPLWAQSDRWNAVVEQTLRDDPWLGWGCKLVMGTVANRVVRLDVTVALRDAAYLADTSDLTDAIQTALRAYFDDRPDWYIWRTSAIKSVVAGADRVRILSCPTTIVRSATGVTIAEPAQPTAGAALTHWVFADNAVSITYTQPA